MLAKRQIIAIVGMPGAGKSTACKFLEKNGFVILRFGDQTDIGLEQMGLPLTEENEKMYREKIRKELGMSAYAVKIKPRIDKTVKTTNKIALDGLYSWEEYVFLKKAFSELFLLCIYARPTIRYARLNHRKVRGRTDEEARNRDHAELQKLNKGGPIAIADYLIDNSSTEAVFDENMRQFLTFLNSQ